MKQISFCIALAALFAVGCGGDEGDDGGIVLDPAPALDDITRVVSVGDNAAGTPSIRSSFMALLMKNDDTLYPEFAGLDLDTRLSNPELIRLERGGDSYHALAALSSPFCICGDACDATGACVDTSEDEPSLVIVSLGLNDIFYAMVSMVLDFTLVDDPQPILDDFRTDVASVLAAFNDKANFPTRPLIAVVNPYEPTDGVGDLVEVAMAFYPQLSPGDITPELINGVLDSIDQILREETETAGAVLVDARSHFRGHGYHFDDPSLPDHDAADQSVWLQYLLDTTPRGAHELRRVIWNELTDDAVTELPGAVPPPDDLLLPIVPDEGWANEVVDSNVTLMFMDATGMNWVNVAENPDDALGPPTASTTNKVALGILGAHITVDLGGGEEAFDGPGPDIVVMEFGSMTGGAPEPYRVLVSENEDGPFIPLADGRGERAYDLAPAGVERARYVRIESQAHIPDVVSGFGSALFPGPEIDAIGAVYPGSAPTP